MVGDDTSVLIAGGEIANNFARTRGGAVRLKHQRLHSDQVPVTPSAACITRTCYAIFDCSLDVRRLSLPHRLYAGFWRVPKRESYRSNELLVPI